MFVACGCNIGYSIGVGCNTTTGLCQCLPGVVGDKCDTCPYRSVLIPDEGCLTCDNCTHGLLDVTDKLRADFEPVNSKFQVIIDNGFFLSNLIQLLEFFEISSLFNFYLPIGKLNDLIKVQ